MCLHFKRATNGPCKKALRKTLCTVANIQAQGYYYTCSHCRRVHNKAGNFTQSHKTRKESLKEMDGLSGNPQDSEIQECSSHYQEGKACVSFDCGHIPVMKNEVLSIFKDKQYKMLLDMTFGGGGHTKALLDSTTDSHIFVLDRDPLAYSIACELAQKSSGRVTAMLGRFSELPTLLSQRGIEPGTLDGVFMDLGSSSMQFDQPERGFSLSADGPLDMRMDSGRNANQLTAADVVNSLDEVDLANIFRKYGEDKRSKKIAHAIVEARSAFGRITRTRQLAEIIENVCDGAYGLDRLGRYSHPATKVFQALRIFVNNELNELNIGLEIACEYLRPGGTCVVISFHSLEDRIVKRHFHSIDLDERNSLSIVQRHRLLDRRHTYSKEELDNIVVRKWEPVSKKVTFASEQEVEENPRSRSAKLRAAVKLDISEKNS